LTNPEEAKKAITSCSRVPDIVICCAGQSLLVRLLIVSGAALPGFFADQSIEHLDFMIKAVYMTALYTAHVMEPLAFSDTE